MKFQSIELSRIDATGRIRPLDPVWVETFREMIAGGDELPPIEVVERGDAFRIVTGFRRHAAHVAADRTTIEARVFTAVEFADEASLRQRQIKANMAQGELTALDRAIHLAAWKELYETVNTTDRRGGNRRGADLDTNSQDFAKRFSLAAADALQVSERSVQIAIQIASGIRPAVRSRIELAPIARVASELLQLSHQDDARQTAIVDLLLSDPPQAGSVAEAVAILDRVPAPTKLTGWERVSDKFSRLPVIEQDRFFSAHADAIDRWLMQRGRRAA
jgi:ParB family chromosome partitioning protein